MGERKEIRTIPELRKAIKECDLVLAQLRFGTNETEVKISKKEALEYIKEIPDDADPNAYEMYAGYFGVLLSDGSLSLG